MRRDADSPKIKAVGVPARLDRHVVVYLSIGVLGTRMVEKVEFIVRKVEDTPSQFGSKVGTPLSVAEVCNLVDSSRIVKDGKQCDNFDVCVSLLCQPNPVFQHSGPVGHTVIAVPRKGVFVEDGVDYGRQIQWHLKPKMDSCPTILTHL